VASSVGVDSGVTAYTQQTRVAKLADAPDLGSGGAILRGSSPLPGTLPHNGEQTSNAERPTPNNEFRAAQIRRSTFDVRCSMFGVRCSTFSVRCSVFDVRCLLLSSMNVESRSISGAENIDMARTAVKDRRYSALAILGGNSQSNRPFIRSTPRSTSATPPLESLQAAPVNAPITSVKVGSWPTIINSSTGYF
jgi:hypothetical protein